MTFEESQKKLEEVVSKLQNADLNLDEGTKLFEEGVALVKQCYDLINKAKGKIEIVSKELDSYINDDTKGDE